MLAKAVDDPSPPPIAGETLAYVVDMLFELSRLSRQANHAELATALNLMARMYRKKQTLPPGDV